MLPRRLLPWLLALTLLFGQAAAFAHTLSHLHDHENGTPDKVCEVCVAHANLGSAAPPTVSTLAIASGIDLIEFAAPLPRVAVRANHAQARAPPVPV